MVKAKRGRIYKRIKSMSYTRREYMGGVPGNRIVQFDVGDQHAEFAIIASLVADERVAITHYALESARVAANRILSRECGATGYHMKIRTYPHEVLRENKQASGAGADRVSQGMRRSFGKAIGTAARVAVGQPIITVRVNVDRFYAVKEAFRKANMKLPTPTHLVFEKGEALALDAMSKGIRAKTAAGSAPVKEKKPAAEGEAGAEGATPAEGAEGAAPAAEAGKEAGKGGKGGKPGAGGKPAAGGKGEAKPAAGGKEGTPAKGGKEEKKGGKK